MRPWPSMDRPYVLGGDIITAVNGQAVGSTSEIAHILLESHPGEVLRLSVYRRAQKLEIPIPLQEMQMRF